MPSVRDTHAQEPRFAAAARRNQDGRLDDIGAALVTNGVPPVLVAMAVQLLAARASLAATT